MLASYFSKKIRFFYDERPSNSFLDLQYIIYLVSVSELLNVAASNSLVIGLDIKDTEPIDGAVLINGLDFVQDGSHKPVFRALKKRQVDQQLIL